MFKKNCFTSAKARLQSPVVSVKNGFVCGVLIARAEKPGFARCCWVLSIIAAVVEIVVHLGHHDRSSNEQWVKSPRSLEMMYDRDRPDRELLTLR